MTKQSGMGGGIYVGGYELSGDVGSLQSVHGGPNLGEVTAIDKSAIERIGLLFSGGIQYSSWFNPTDVTGSHDVLKALPYTDSQVTYRVDGTLGGPAATCLAKQVNYDGTRGADASFSFSVDAQSNGYSLLWGEALTAGTRTDTAATNGTAIDFGAVSTLFGAFTALHVISVTGTSVTVTIEDSADNVSFTPITGLAFTAVAGAAVSQQFLATSATATIRRYVRAATTGTFSNAQFHVNFVRNLTLTAL